MKGHRKALATQEVVGAVIVIIVSVYIFSFFAVPAVSTYYNETGGTTTFTTKITYTTVVNLTSSTRTTTSTRTNLPMGGNVPAWFSALLAICLIGVPVTLLLKYLEVF
jgi:predicted membrane channel-forming protein YqfA (hemolysin III family)